MARSRKTSCTSLWPGCCSSCTAFVSRLLNSGFCRSNSFATASSSNFLHESAAAAKNPAAQIISAHGTAARVFSCKSKAASPTIAISSANATPAAIPNSSAPARQTLTRLANCVMPLWFTNSLPFNDTAARSLRDVAHQFRISAQLALLDRRAYHFHRLRKLRRFADVIVQSHFISSRRKRPGFGDENIAARARLNVRALSGPFNNKTRPVRCAIEIASADDELHRLLAGVIAFRRNQRRVGAGKKLAARNQPLQKRNPKTMIRRVALVL